jgi:hypothetical protein
MLLFVFNLISYDMLSQENIKTNFYKLNIPKNTTVKTFAKNHEELANIDAYQFNADEKPKYIMYLMSNKTNVEITSINIDNYKDFLFDLGDLKLSRIENLEDKLKINFTYSNKENIKGIIYMSVKNNILHRFVFLFPNENSIQIFQNEVDEMINNITEIKEFW